MTSKKFNKLKILFMAVMVVGFVSLQWGTIEASSVKPWHPRLFVMGNAPQETKAQLDWIKGQLQAGGIYDYAFQKALACSGGNCERYGGGFMVKIFRSLSDEVYRLQSINEAKARIVQASFYPSAFEVVWILTMFDWFRDQWNNAETQQLLDFMENVVVRNQWTNYRNILNNHFHEDSAVQRILPGLVLYGEGVDVETENWLRDRSNYWMKEQLSPAYNTHAGSFGANPEGYSYWGAGYPYLAVVAMAWTSATNENLFQTWEWSNFAKSALSLWRPFDGFLTPWSDGNGFAFGTDKFGGGRRTTFTVFLPLMRWGNSAEAAFVYKNIKGIPDGLAGIDVSTGYGDIYIKYIFGDAFGPRHNPAPVALSALPKSVYFDDYQGVVIREGWGDNDTMFTYKQNKLLAGHDHHDAGSFMIARGAGLAVKGGYYSSNGDVVDDHTLYYYPRTIASNVVTVYKPSQQTNVQWWGSGAALDTMGGQKGHGLIGGDRRPTFYQDGLDIVWDRGDIIRFEYDQDKGYTYFIGDVTPAYYSDSVANFTRSVFSPDSQYFVILDRVSSVEASYSKRWLLHSKNQPVILDGNNLGALGGGASAYSGVQFYVENGPSKLFVKMFSPSNNNADTLVFRGGSGYEYWTSFGASGFNAVPRRSHWGGDNPEPGTWRIEQKIEGEKDSIFLNVLRAADVSVANIGNVVSLQTSPNVIGVMVNSNFILFAKVETKITGGLAENIIYQVSGQGTSKHLIVDLRPNTQFTITNSNLDTNQQVSEESKVSSSQGTLYFTTQLGSNHRISITPGGTAPVRGDVNGDGLVNVVDVQLAVNQFLGVIPQTQEADLNNDGVVNVIDVQLVVNIILGG